MVMRRLEIAVTGVDPSLSWSFLGTFERQFCHSETMASCLPVILRSEVVSIAIEGGNCYRRELNCNVGEWLKL